MRIASLHDGQLNIPFRTAFRHAAAERRSTETIWVEAQAADGTPGFGEGCPRHYVTGETLATARAFIARHRREWLAHEWDLPALERWRQKHRAEIDANPAAWASVELALLDLLGKTAGRSVESLLQISPAKDNYFYTAVLGDSAPGEFAAQLARYRQFGFRAYKVKLASDRGRNRAIAHALAAAGISPNVVRADANNLWPDPDTAIDELGALQFPFWAVEEPLATRELAAWRTIARQRGVKIILDESVLRAEQVEPLASDPENWIINIRVSKMGGLLRALDVLHAARRFGIKVVVGAQVGESSLLTRAGLAVASAAGEALIGQEGAFGTLLLTQDVIEPPLMFGAGGQLRMESSGCGLGLTISSARLRSAGLLQPAGDESWHHR